MTKYITISDNAEVDLTEDKGADALLVLTADQAKELLVQLTARMREANII
jgi:hypothetical protein